MKFRVTRSSDYLGHKEYVEIATLEESMDFVKEKGDIIIHELDSDRENLPFIEIYDDWRE